ncbi:MAG: ISNCY family transposase [Pseudomonadales bacterium]|nr:ISNCY family transposase [Pseudomonadales bacterium]
MRETRVAQINIFETYSQHAFGIQLKQLSKILDRYPEILALIENDLIEPACKKVGATGLAVETVFRCLLLKQQLRCSYEQLAFHLSDSTSYRAFTRLPDFVYPSRSGLQSVIRKIKPETLETVHQLLAVKLLEDGTMSLEKIRIDSTVVKSHITPPSDSQLLNDSVRVLSRLLAKSGHFTGLKIRFTDKRKASKSLAFQIFNAKNAQKERLYPELLKLVRVVQRQIERGLSMVKAQCSASEKMLKWQAKVEHYRDLLLKVVNQTERRVINKEKVHSSEKIVSIFEEHTDIIVKGYRDIQYGHKINLASDVRGFITYLAIEEGNPADSEQFMPIIRDHEALFNALPHSVACDGGYASMENVTQGRALGIKRVVFHKRVGISNQAMGVKEKTFKVLRNFRAGIEGNISELKRAFGAGRAEWKGEEGFKAFVWSSVITYNLVRLARLESG